MRASTPTLCDQCKTPGKLKPVGRARDGYEFGGNRIRVELSRGSDRGQRGPRGERPPPPVPRTLEGRGTGFRATVTGLPDSASWQDLKVRAGVYAAALQARRSCRLPGRPAD